MRAQAPGKVVLSGAYSILDGAPAIVSAVDRYVLADAARTADFLTDEVRASHICPAPWFDASALRTENRKLGLGSSAAILAASLAANALRHGSFPTDVSLATTVFPKALEAHAAVQPLGSGIDVCATCFGGTRIAQLRAGKLEHEQVPLPSHLCVEVWAAPRACSTDAMLAILFEYRGRHAHEYSRLMQTQADASERAASALLKQNAGALVSALCEQRVALENLGRAAGLCIVTDEVSALADAASMEAAMLPSMLHRSHPRKG